jgi:hypothetical protein
VRVPWAHQLWGSVSKLGAVTALVPVDPLKGAGVYVLHMLPYLQRTKQPGEDGADTDLVFVSSVIQKVQLQGVSARGLNRQRSFLLEIRALSPHAEQR